MLVKERGLRPFEGESENQCVVDPRKWVLCSCRGSFCKQAVPRLTVGVTVNLAVAAVTGDVLSAWCGHREGSGCAEQPELPQRFLETWGWRAGGAPGSSSGCCHDAVGWDTETPVVVARLSCSPGSNEHWLV